jgi:FAD binding domain
VCSTARSTAGRRSSSAPPTRPRSPAWVALARDSGLELAVRGGGHSVAGHGTSDGGILLDLGAMKTLGVDPHSRTAWAQTGLTAGEYTTAAHAHGLATGFGDTPSVGIGGLTLGGGIGYLVRKHGLTVDDLLAAELVTADGEVLHVDDDSHPDLFWAIRGGGGNFGVATRFRFRLHPLDRVVGGMLLLPATPEVIAGFIAAAQAAPEELSAIANIMKAPSMPPIPEQAHGRPVIMALLCYAGEVDAGERAVAPFRALATPLADLVRPMPYPEIYQFTEGGPGPDHEAARSLFLDTVDLPAAEAIVERLLAATAPLAVAQLRVLGGGDGQGAGRRHRLRPPRAAHHGRHRRGLGAARRRRGRGARGLGGRVRGRAAPGRPGRVRELRRRRGPGAGPRGLPGVDLGAAGGGQAALRPHQPVPPQPEHPTGGRGARGMSRR